MIRQDFVIAAAGKFESKKRYSKKSQGDAEHHHIWEVRHAGLLGIKYEVAVRSDIFDYKSGMKSENDFITSSSEGTKVLGDVVEAAILGCVVPCIAIIII